MKVKLLVPRAAATGSQNRGDVVEVSAADAERMVKAGQAEHIRAKKKETATPKRKAERAAK